MGLGLSVCRSITEAHSGTLEVPSLEPFGATFKFTVSVLPASRRHGSRVPFLPSFESLPNVRSGPIPAGMGVIPKLRLPPAAHVLPDTRHTIRRPIPQGDGCLHAHDDWFIHKAHANADQNAFDVVHSRTQTMQVIRARTPLRTLNFLRGGRSPRGHRRRITRRHEHISQR
jgi:hypothetical protein